MAAAIYLTIIPAALGDVSLATASILSLMPSDNSVPIFTTTTEIVRAFYADYLKVGAIVVLILVPLLGLNTVTVSLIMRWLEKKAQKQSQ